MFNRNGKNVDEHLDASIDRLLTQMDSVPADTDAYKQMSDNLTKLYAAKNASSKPRLTPDAIVAIASNLGVAALVIAFEQKNVITTKALSFVSKLR